MAAMLSRDRFQAARAFVEAGPRPLDAALLRHGLGEADTEAVMVALIAFQNPDGGFGHGLEADMRSPASTAIATSIGLRLLARVAAPARHPTVIGAIDWLAGALDREAGVWPIVGPDVAQAPHAPWWTWSEGLSENWNGFRFNPTAEILAHLYHYRDAVAPDLLGAVEAGLRFTLAETELIENAYDLKCAIRLGEAGGAPADLVEPLDALVRRSIATHDPGDEHASPFDAAATPTSRFANAVAAAVPPALDAVIETQADDGGWSPGWNWSFVDKAAWKAAERDWRSWITREALEVLLAWGRVEGR
ncbi:MAG TPA: hypothetical protein VGG29_16450 [Caulobacteraceae bacterium]|jgi:hypothetical protein